ncbi:hypothetical protein N7478_008781 [Penicillium angulare]|uniref:uncharacterized protein n=1 Tax=Penicillium angulare TaxID=116970 RepID=UPI002541FDAA|nr:uncharacterized protein N7478_008781 [Penicillium angulare]KAJ5273656.1 hypothetical protein N7478_008781 [Penicillium angulare]
MATDSHLEAPATFTEFDPQQTCPLFSLPAELRYEIFSHALTSAPDKTRPIDQDAYCTRPGYETLSRTYAELLRTCKRIYMEAWFMPFLLSEHPFYMAWQNRSPKRVMSVSKMQKCLDLIYERHGKVEGGAVRIFAQLWALEGTKDCSGVLSMKNFYPKTITITIRYTDTWMWEENQALRIGGAWSGRLALPSSVTRFKIDFESIERRKDEVDYIVRGFATRWCFRRRDGVNLVADGDKSISVSRWTGSSTLGDSRWVRDETRPGKLDYYVGTVTWRPSKEPPSPDEPSNPSLRVDWRRPEVRSLTYNTIRTEFLQRAGVPEGATAEEAIFIIDEYRARVNASDNDRSSLGEWTESEDANSEEEEEDDDDDDYDDDNSSEDGNAE